jgi:CHASE2 domain-containing sensor protein
MVSEFRTRLRDLCARAQKSRPVKLGLIVATYAAFTFINPFGLQSSTNHLSEQFVYRLMSLWQRDAAEHISVLLVNDASARKINGENGYPITFSQHATALKHTLCTGPAALFIDITFRGLRGEPSAASVDPAEGQQETPIDPLLKALAIRPSADDEYCRLPDVGRFHPSTAPQVFMARTRSHPPDDCDPLYGKTLADECRIGRVIDQLATVSTPISVGSVLENGAYQLVNVRDRDDASASAGLEPSPALAMVFAFCEAAKGTPRADLPGCRDKEALRDLLVSKTVEPRHTLYPVWSFFKTPTYMNDRRENASGDTETADRSVFSTCKLRMRRDVGLMEKIELISREFWQSIFIFDKTSAFEQKPCLPADTISLNDLHEMAGYCGGSESACRERVAKFFSGRMVFYGIDVTGINDLVRTPVVGLIPGAAYHAAAAETLLNYGKSYHRQPDALGGVIAYDKIFEIVIFAAAAGFVTLIFRLRGGGSKGRYVANCIICGMLTLIGVAAAVSLALAYSAGLPTLTAVAALIGIAAYCYLMTTTFVFRLDQKRAFGFRAGRRIAAMAVGAVIVVPMAIVMTMLLNFPPANVIASIVLLAQLPAEP